MANEQTFNVVQKVRLVFDGPPGPEGPRFIEAEDIGGNSISVGKWIELGIGLDGRALWALELEMVVTGTVVATVEGAAPAA